MLIKNLFKPDSQIWDDSKSSETVKEILKKHAQFDLFKYLECAKIVFLAYLGKIEKAASEGIDAMEYVLTHARLFGDTTKSIFQMEKLKETLERESKGGSAKKQLPPLPKNKLINKISQLIQDLATTYDETKFVILNVNTTYFTLLMLRRIIKNEAEFLNTFKNIQTHDTYVKLCSSPLDNQLPKCGFKVFEQQLVNCAYLAIEAYLNTKDEKTRRVLRATSILHMEWNGLQLPELFFKVVSLYKIEADELFGLLFNDACESSALMTCCNFAEDYYETYEKLRSGLTNRWFPYCRVLDGAYHSKLSVKENVETCALLAYLVDMKIGFDRSTIRMSHWVKPHLRKTYMQRATLLIERLNKQVRTDWPASVTDQKASET